MIKWFISHNYFRYTDGRINILPYIDLWYYKDWFLRPNVNSPAFGFTIGWIKWKWAFAIQKKY
jgi:hypothetical protein